MYAESSKENERENEKQEKKQLLILFLCSNVQCFNKGIEDIVHC